MPGRPNPNRMTPARIAQREREARCVEMKLAGLPNEVIAQAVGYKHRSNVAKAIKKCLDERVNESVDEIRKLEVARCDRLIQALWRDALEGKYLAVDRVLRVMERKAQIQGLDAPVRRELTVINKDTFSEFIEARKDELKQLRAAIPEDVIDADYTEIEDDTEAAVVMRLSDGA